MKKIIIVLIIFASFSIFGKFLLNDGLYIFGDTIWFSSLSTYSENLWTTWNIFGGGGNIETIARLPISGWIFILGNYIDNPHIAEKIFVILLISLNIIPISYTSYKILNKYFNSKISSIGSIFATYLYTFNPITISLISLFYPWLGYSLLPIGFYFFDKALEENKMKYMIITAIILYVVSSTYIHWFIFYTMVFTIYLIIFAPKKIISIKVFIFVYLIFILFSMAWIIPTSNILLKNNGLAPSYVVTKESVEMFSSESDLFNTIRLMGKWGMHPGDWGIYHGESPDNYKDYWFISTLIFPIIFILSIFMIIFRKRNRYIIFFSLIFLPLIFLATGTQLPFDIYIKLLNIPIIGWLFRVPNKFLWLSIFPLCIMLSFAVANIKYYFNRFISSIIFFILLILISSASWQLFLGDVDKRTEPVYFPDNVKIVNKIIDDGNNNSKALWIPYTSFTEWNKKSMGDFYTYSSSVEPIVLDSQVEKYVYKMLDKDLSSETFYKIMETLNVRYIIWHEDYIRKGLDYDPKKLYNLNKYSKLIYKDPIFSIFELNNRGPITTSNQNIDIIGGLENINSIYFINNGTNLPIIFVNDQPNNIFKFASYIVINNIDDNILLSDLSDKNIIRPFDFTIRHNPSIIWSKGGTKDPLHGPWHQYIENRNINNWDFDYSKGIVFTWANSLIDNNNVNPSEQDLYYRNDFENGLEDWSVDSNNRQSIKIGKEPHSGLYSFNVILNESTSGWKTINSPLISVNYNTPYRIELFIKGENSWGIHAKILEFDVNKNIINVIFPWDIGTGTFNWKKILLDYKSEKKGTKFIQIQIWHGYETSQPLPNKIWIDDIEVYNLSRYVKPVTIDMDLNVDKEDDYELFIRYFKNKDGWRINISIDGKLKYINTRDQLNKFVWEKVDTLNLKKGKYRLTLTNDEGFNAVNIFALTSKKEYEEMEKNIESLIKGKRLIYIFEAESDLYRNANISKKYGGRSSNGEVLEFNDTSRAWQNIDIIRSDNYKMALKINGSFDVKIDNTKYNVSSDMSDFTYIGPIFLNKGNHKIEIEKSGNEEYSDLDVIWIYNTSEKINIPKIKSDIVLRPIYIKSKEVTIKIDKRRGFTPVNIQSNIIEINQNDKVIWFNEEVIPVTLVNSEFGEKLLDYEKRISYNFTKSGSYQFYFKENKNHNVTIVVKPIYSLDDKDVNVVNNNEERLEDIFKVDETPATVSNYTKIDPTLYKMKINATKPFMISFAESYDPLWTAKVDKINGKDIESEIVRPILLYSVVNGFWINQTGNLDITIEYEPQRWFYIGSAISITTLIICIGYLIYDWRRKKNK